MIKGRRFVPTVTVALAVLMGLPSHASAMSQVPFRATVTESVMGIALCPPPPQTRYVCVKIVGTGQATHLGAIRESAVIRVDTAGGTGPMTAGCAPEVRTSILTAANGDTITLQGPGQSCGDNHHQIASDMWSVISGTGRFAGATGSGTNSVSIDRVTNPVTSVTTFIGTISSPGSRR